MFKRHFERLQKEHHSGDRLGGELELTFSNPTSRGHVNVSFLSLQPALSLSLAFSFSLRMKNWNKINTNFLWVFLNGIRNSPLLFWNVWISWSNSQLQVNPLVPEWTGVGGAEREHSQQTALDLDANGRCVSLSERAKPFRSSVFVRISTENFITEKSHDQNSTFRLILLQYRESKMESNQGGDDSQGEDGRSWRCVAVTAR